MSGYEKIEENKRILEKKKELCFNEEIQRKKKNKRGRIENYTRVLDK